MASNPSNHKVFCESTNDRINTFSLAANLNINQNTETVTTEAVITLQNLETKLMQAASSLLIPSNNVIVLESRGFFRSIDTLGGYVHAILVPLAGSNEVLSMDLKIDINRKNQSVIQLEGTKRYYSNCKTI